MENIKDYYGYFIDRTGTIIQNRNVRARKLLVVIGDHIIDGKPTGYKYASLCNYLGKWKRIAVHRLVALTYIENPDNLPEVNHKDLDKSNNNDWNLEWVTKSQNIQHAWDNNDIRKLTLSYKRSGTKASDATRKIQSEQKLGKNHPKFKGFYMVHHKQYESANQAGKETKECIRTILRKCKSGKILSEYYFIPTI